MWHLRILIWHLKSSDTKLRSNLSSLVNPSKEFIHKLHFLILMQIVGPSYNLGSLIAGMPECFSSIKLLKVQTLAYIYIYKPNSFKFPIICTIYPSKLFFLFLKYIFQLLLSYVNKVMMHVETEETMEHQRG